MGNRPTRRNYGKMRSAVATVARERLDLLLRQAEEVLSNQRELSKRYVGLAKKISKRTKVRILREKKHYLCKKCGLPLVPGKNARVRLRSPNSRIIISCLACGAIRRYPYRKRVQARIFQ
ncbi:MAG TPA: ribonuclease P protein component 4 [Candidatus Sulfotelmatobacter sp.]|nr:ribonuclease P protein component 4 [Candidatus Sulfotelmatobacter sp.]